MKTPFIPKLILLFILFFLYSAGYAQQRDSVTIRGQVTDYNGQPIDSCIIRKSKFPQNPKRSVRFSGKRTKRSVQKRKARNTQKAETKVL